MQASLREACRGRLLPPSLRLSLWRAYLVVPALEGRAAEALSRISGSQNQLRMPLLMRAALNRAEAALSATAPDGGSQAAAREGGSADGRLSPRPSGSLEAARGGDDGWKERAAPALNALHLMLGDSFDADAAVLLRLADTAVEAAAALGSDAAQGTDVTVLRSAITYTLATALWHSTATAGLRQAQRAVEALRGVDDELQTALGRQLTLDAVRLLPLLHAHSHSCSRPVDTPLVTPCAGRHWQLAAPAHALAVDAHCLRGRAGLAGVPLCSRPGGRLR